MKFLKNRKFIFISLMLALFFIFNFSIVQAASLKDAGAKLGDAASRMGYESNGGGSIESIIGMVITTVLSFLGVVFLVLIIYSGFLWMTAGGNEEKITKSKNIIKNATIGLAVVMAAYLITTFVISQLAEQTGFKGEGGDSGGGDSGVCMVAGSRRPDLDRINCATGGGSWETE